MLLLPYKFWCLFNFHKLKMNVYQFLGDKRSIETFIKKFKQALNKFHDCTTRLSNHIGCRGIFI